MTIKHKAISVIRLLFARNRIQRIVMTAALLTGAVSGFASPGDLDPSFGQGNVVVTSFVDWPYWDFPRSLQIQPDGKIVVCGEIREGDDDGNVWPVSFFLARYLPDGMLDPSFGTNGKVIAPINSGDELVGHEIALQPNGKIVAVGVNGSGNNIAVNRYNSDGTLDPSFGVGGKIITPVGITNSDANSVTVQPDGKIVVVGSGVLDPFNGGFGIIRYNPNGSLDTSFGEGGKVITQFSNFSAYANAVMVQPNGKIVVAGQAGGNGSYDRHFAVARYNADGSLDAGFGTGGKIVQTFPSAEAYLTDALLLSDGRIVVAGQLFSANPPTLAIVRYNANGSIDTSFAANGIFTSPYTFFMGDGIAVQPDGKIVSFGRVHFAVSAVLRLNQNGSLDTGFGANGIANTNLGNSYGLAGAIQPNGGIVFLGYTWTGGDIVLARFLGDPAVLVSGRVMSPSGLGIRNAVVTLTDSAGNRRSTVTSTLGFYSFTDIPPGQTVTIGASSRRYRFQPVTRTMNENLSDVDLVGIE